MATSHVPVVGPAHPASGPAQGAWTVADYLALPADGQRYEILGGVLLVSPSPTFDHQAVALAIATVLRAQIMLRGLGKVAIAPFDVELNPQTIVQPDVVVVLAEHADRLTTERIVGAPDLVVEVVSPSTARYDRLEKQNAYAMAGVPEYWIADPATRSIELLFLADGTYPSQGIFLEDATLPSRILPELPTVRDMLSV